MKRILLALTILGILILNIAALDDITTGNEPDYRLEWATVILSLVILVSVIFYFAKRKHKRIRS